MKSSLHLSLTEFRNESRVLREAETLIKNGLVKKVYVAALHAPGLSPEEEYIPAIFLRRFRLISRRYGSSLVIRAVKYVEYCIRVYFFYKHSDVRVINVHALSLLPLGMVLKWAYDALLVYDTHELETENNGSAGLYKKLRKWLEQRIIIHCDLVVVVSESIADWYEHEYRITRPTVVLNAPRKRRPFQKDIFREQMPIRVDQKIALYQGGLGPGRGILSILEAFRERRESNVVAVFMGYGTLETKVRDAARQYSNVFFYPAVPPDVLLDYTASADIGISLIENTCLSYYYCMPNKLFEYAMAGLPVIVSNMKEMATFVSTRRMGAVIDKFTPKAINSTIDDILSRDLKKMGHNAYQAACDCSWEKQEAKLLSAYARIGLMSNYSDVSRFRS